MLPAEMSWRPIHSSVPNNTPVEEEGGKKPLPRSGHLGGGGKGGGWLVAVEAETCMENFWRHPTEEGSRVAGVGPWFICVRPGQPAEWSLPTQGPLECSLSPGNLFYQCDSVGINGLKSNSPHVPTLCRPKAGDENFFCQVAQGKAKKK